MTDKEEIIIHKDQITLDDFLKEENNRCLDCQWCYGGELICTCPSSEFRGQDVSFQDCSECDQFYNEFDSLIAEDTETKRMDF